MVNWVIICKVMRKIVDTVVHQLVTDLGEQLEAVFLYGSLAQGFYQPDESDINLFLVVSDTVDLHHLRELFAPIWQKHATVLKKAPCLATRSAFVRHMRLNTLLAHHFMRDGQKLHGTKKLLNEHLKPLNPAEAYAYLANEAMQVSQVLMPDVLEEETAVSLHKKLRSIVRRIQKAPITTDETTAQLFARVQHYLTPLVNKLPEINQWEGLDAPLDTSPILPGLGAIYEETGKLVLAFSQLTPHQILRADWSGVAEQVPESALGVQITSINQLYLIANYEHPLHLNFMKYEHSWGPNFLGDMTLIRNQILRQAARLPSHILVDEMPNAFLTHDEDYYAKLIHDFQNRLLNVQLEHELMVRFKIIERFVPPEPLPGRDEDARLRVEAIFKHLNWWSAYYESQIE